MKQTKILQSAKEKYGISQLSNEYQSFVNSEKEENGEVKFIIMSDSIKKKKEGKEQNK